MFITDRNLSKRKLTDIVNDFCKAGVKAIQLREKDLTTKDLLDLSFKLRKITNRYKTKFIINDRIDIAELSKADGIHSTAKGLTAKQINSVLKKLIIGKSVHSVKEARLAEQDGFDYILFGPIYRTPAKIKYGSPQGLDKLKKVCLNVNIPVFAVGGINPMRAKGCIDAGAYGVAVIREIMQSKNIAKTMKDFESAIGEL